MGLQDDALKRISERRAAAEASSKKARADKQLRDTRPPYGCHLLEGAHDAIAEFIGVMRQNRIEPLPCVEFVGKPRKVRFSRKMTSIQPSRSLPFRAWPAHPIGVREDGNITWGQVYVSSLIHNFGYGCLRGYDLRGHREALVVRDREEWSPVDLNTTVYETIDVWDNTSRLSFREALVEGATLLLAKKVR